MTIQIQTTREPTVDTLADKVIENGSVAMVDDMREIMRRQEAQMFGFGSPQFYISTNATNSEVTFEYRVPAGVQWIAVGLFCAGDGGFLYDTSGGGSVKTGKAKATVDIKSDSDTNGTYLYVNTYPDNWEARFSDIDSAEMIWCHYWWDPSSPASEEKRLLRVASEADAITNNTGEWLQDTIRINIPTGVTVYGVSIMPSHTDFTSYV